MNIISILRFSIYHNGFFSHKHAVIDLNTLDIYCLVEFSRFTYWTYLLEKTSKYGEFFGIANE